MPTHQSNKDVYNLFIRAFPLSRLQYRVASASWMLEGRPITTAELVRKVAFETDCSRTKVENAIQEAGFQQEQAATVRLETWLDNIEKRPVDDRALRRWLHLIVGDSTDDLMHEAHVVAMKQWLWQVKRNIRHKQVVWHVCPVFWSTTGGTGKSFNVKRLYQPLSTVARSLEVGDLGEKFSGPMLARTRIVLFDEFAGAGKVDSAQLKALLTGKDIDSRVMYSEAGFHAKNRVSCIATSNLAPPHGFVDHTGARRFWSIRCSSERMDSLSTRRAQLDDVDISEVWAAISVDDQSPQYTTPREVLAFMDAEREHHLRTKTSLENFCHDCLVSSEGDRIKFKDLVKNYKKYCADTNQAVVRGGYRVLREHLEQMGLEVANVSNVYFLKHFDLQEESTFAA